VVAKLSTHGILDLGCIDPCWCGRVWVYTHINMEGQVFTPCPKRAAAESTCLGVKKEMTMYPSPLNACMPHAHATHLHPVPSKGVPTICSLHAGPSSSPPEPWQMHHFCYLASGRSIDGTGWNEGARSKTNRKLSLLHSWLNVPMAKGRRKWCKEPSISRKIRHEYDRCSYQEERVRD
jgi:hypothetical protein